MSPIGAPAVRDPVHDGLGAGTRSSSVELLLEELARLSEARDRADLAARLEDARRRVARTETIVCVVGEFKQGKSALINALLGEPVCPVDDDLATVAVTMVRYADAPGATVRRRDADGLVVEAVAPDSLPDWVTERANPDNRRNVELVEVGLPNPFLAQGITLIDTPGVGGLNATHAVATLAFLPLADALIFVTDASAELSGPEMTFLASAREAGRPVIVGFTKIDLYPEWRRIREINEQRLAASDGDLPIYALSAVLRLDARGVEDDDLVADSGFPPLARDLLGDVSDRAKGASLAAAVDETVTAVRLLREPLATELEAIEHPEDAERLAAELDAVRERLADLAGASATWSARLDDEFAGLRSRVEFAFHGHLRHVVRDAHNEIDGLDPAKDWTKISEHVQQQVAGAVRVAFEATSEGVQSIQETIADLLADEQLGLDESAHPSVDVSAMWQPGQTFTGPRRTGLGAGFALLAGATVGVEVLGMVGLLLGTALVGPALLGATVFFGGKEMLEERRRRLADHRQEARTFVTTFVDNVQFEVDGRLAGLIGDVQARMRAEFGARIQELLRTTQDGAAGLESTIRSTEEERDRRRAELRVELDGLEGLRERADALREPPTRAPD
ncbi:MAG TPA: dynamin family protein [Candidatus Limnocylindrales bacterium]